MCSLDKNHEALYKMYIIASSAGLNVTAVMIADMYNFLINLDFDLSTKKSEQTYSMLLYWPVSHSAREKEI